MEIMVVLNQEVIEVVVLVVWVIGMIWFSSDAVSMHRETKRIEREIEISRIKILLQT